LKNLTTDFLALASPATRYGEFVGEELD